MPSDIDRHLFNRDMCRIISRITGKYTSRADFQPNQSANAKVLVCCNFGAALDTGHIDMGVRYAEEDHRKVLIL